ncbi:MAG: endonuclease III [Nitrospiraceae bacterium]|nr:endonuclease III [Nitrospiraceae bacterium]
MTYRLLRVATFLKDRKIPAPGIEQLGISGDPYRVLVSTILSLRTRDRVMEEASKRLFSMAPDLEHLARLSEGEIQDAIYPVGFYRTKARTIKQIAKMLMENFQGVVPSLLEELLSLPGVGLKTANLVLSQGFGNHALCVDTHVHRIMNRWGSLRTGSPDETFRVLDQALPPEIKSAVNPLLVSLGQALCHPLSPRCSLCVLVEECPKIQVLHQR